MNRALTLQRCTEIGSFGAHKIFILCTVQHGQTVPMCTFTRVFCCVCVVSGTDGLTGYHAKEEKKEGKDRGSIDALMDGRMDELIHGQTD